MPSAAHVVFTADDLAKALEEPHRLVIVSVHVLKGKRAMIKLEDVPRDLFDLVIVDDAHHVPARAWAQTVEHFCPTENPKARAVFLTATSVTSKGYILGPAGGFQHTIEPCHKYEIEETKAEGFIRHVTFQSVGVAEDNQSVALQVRVREGVPRHHLPPHSHSCHAPSLPCIIPQLAGMRRRHCCRAPRARYGRWLGPAQGACPVQRRFRGEAGDRDVLQGIAKAFVSGVSSEVLEEFKAFGSPLRVLTVCGRLVEDFDHSPVSVIGILRTVQSRVLFTHFVGRSLCKTSRDDPVEAVVVSHPKYAQRAIFDALFPTGRSALITNVLTDDVTQDTTEAEVVVVKTLEDFVAAVGPVEAQRAVGVAMQDLFPDETVAGLWYIAKDDKGAMRWAVARGGHMPP